MAVKVCAYADAVWTGASTWEVLDATAHSDSQAANTALTTSYVESSTFTPGAITIDGIAVKLASRAASPSGTISIHLATGGVEVAGTAVTLNVSDLPTCSANSSTTVPGITGEGGWLLITFTPVLLIALTAYTVGAKTSVGSQVNLYSTATTNWSRFLRTTTTASVGAGDEMVITGEWTSAGNCTNRTVTMDCVATTDFGLASTDCTKAAIAICKNGTLTWQTTASTAYYLKSSGHVQVYNGGTLKVGFTGGAEIPRTSSAVLEMDCGADGDFGVIQRNGSVALTQGLSRTAAKLITWTKLTVDMAAAATSATVADDTGWKNGDDVAFSPTSQTHTQSDRVTLNADGTTALAWTGGTTNGHLGTAPTQGEAILLTRNVVFRSATSTNTTFWFVGGTATLDSDWTQYKYFSNNANGKRGINFEGAAGGSCTLDYCSFSDTEADVIYLSTSAGTLTVNQCTSYNNGGTGAVIRIDATSTAAVTITNNCFCPASAGNANGCTNWAGAAFVGTMTGNCFSGTFGFCVTVSTGPIITAALWNNNEIHSCRGGLQLSVASTTTITGTISQFTIWHNSSTGGAGFNLTDFADLIIDRCKFYGNATANLRLVTTNQRFATLTLLSCEGYGTTSFATTSNILTVDTLVVVGRIEMHNCTWSVAGGVKVAATNDIKLNATMQFCPIYAENCFFSGTNAIATFNTSDNIFLASNRHGQADATHKRYFNHGTILSNASVFNTSAPSAEMQPLSASVKLKVPLPKVPALDGATPTLTVAVRKSAAYNGNAPRFIIKQKNSVGITADTVGDTLSVGADTWEDLTYTMPALPDNGLIETYVDCDGTAGSVYVDDLRVT